MKLCYVCTDVEVGSHMREIVCVRRTSFSFLMPISDTWTWNLFLCLLSTALEEIWLICCRRRPYLSHTFSLHHIFSPFLSHSSIVFSGNVFNMNRFTYISPIVIIDLRICWCAPLYIRLQWKKKLCARSLTWYLLQIGLDFCYRIEVSTRANAITCRSIP